MLLRQTPIDFIAYNSDGTVVLLAGAKTRLGTSPAWAGKLRRNVLAHNLLPPSQYFLIATPDRVYGWQPDNLAQSEALPQFTIDAHEALKPYFSKFKQDPANISPRAFELLILAWLTDITNARTDKRSFDPSLAALVDSGLLSSLQQTEIEMNVDR